MQMQTTKQHVIPPLYYQQGLAPLPTIKVAFSTKYLNNFYVLEKASRYLYTNGEWVHNCKKHLLSLTLLYLLKRTQRVHTSAKPKRNSCILTQLKDPKMTKYFPWIPSIALALHMEAKYSNITGCTATILGSTLKSNWMLLLTALMMQILSHSNHTNTHTHITTSNTTSPVTD